MKINSHRKSKTALVISLLLVLLVILFFVKIAIGPVSIPLSGIVGVIIGNQTSDLWNVIIWHTRFPETITAILAGAGLSICGLQMQYVFRNPLAGPSVLGITSGASLGVAILTMTTGVGLFSATSGLSIAIASMAGAILVLLIILAVSMQFKDSVTVLIVGLMIGFSVSALVTVLSYYASKEQLQQFVFWGFGSFQSITLFKLPLFSIGVLLLILCAALLIKPLNAIIMGDDYATSIGVNVKLYRMLIILCCGLLTGWITSYCGPIAFLGLAVPHISRNIFKSMDNRIIFPATLLTGSVLALCCSIITNLPVLHTSFPLNAVTSLIGAPVVIWVIIRRRKMNRAF